LDAEDHKFEKIPEEIEDVSAEQPTIKIEYPKEVEEAIR
jgi:hypothetical protein